MYKKVKIFKRGRGGNDPQHIADSKLYHELLVRHCEIGRVTKEIEFGIETITRVTSKDKELIKILQDHALGMKKRFDGNRAIRSWDPLFIELFDHREQSSINSEMLEDGIRVTLTSDDEKVRELIKLHDETLHAFVKHGFKASSICVTRKGAADSIPRL